MSHVVADTADNLAVSNVTRHPAFIRWSVITEECLDILSAEPPALPMMSVV